MRIIHKFEVFNDRFTLLLPANWKFLTTNVHGNTPAMWIEYDTDHPKQICDFVVVGTGWELDVIKLGSDESSSYLGTYFQSPWVWHLYQITKRKRAKKVKSQVES